VFIILLVCVQKKSFLAITELQTTTLKIEIQTHISRVFAARYPYRHEQLPAVDGGGIIVDQQELK